MTTALSDPVDPVDAPGGGAPNPGTPPIDQVSYDTHKKVLDEKKKAQKRAEDAEAKLAQIEEDRLKAAGDLQKIIDAEKERNKNLQSENESFKKMQERSRKLGAFIKASDTSLDSKWYDMVDVDSIAFKEGTDEIDPMSVTKQVDVFKKRWPEAFKPVSSMPPPTEPNGNGKVISEDEFKKLKAKEMAKYKYEGGQYVLR